MDLPRGARPPHHHGLISLRINPDYPRCPNGSAGNFLSKGLKNFAPQEAQTILRSEIENDFPVQFAQHHKFRTLLFEFHFKKHCSPHDALSHLPPQLILNRQQAIVLCQSFRTRGRAAFQIVRVDCRREIAEEARFRIAASVRKHHRIPRSPRQRNGFGSIPTYPRSSSSIASRRLYFANRSERAGAPHFR